MIGFNTPFLSYNDWMNGLTHDEQLSVEKHGIKLGSVFDGISFLGVDYNVCIIGLTVDCVMTLIQYDDGLAMPSYKLLSDIVELIESEDYKPRARGS